MKFIIEYCKFCLSDICQRIYHLIICHLNFSFCFHLLLPVSILKALLKIKICSMGSPPTFILSENFTLSGQGVYSYVH